jgi:glyoxylase-like metal-dependent hydrolase (beta-lactamase superfamily II)
MVELRAGRPRPVTEVAFGPPVVPGEPVEVVGGVVRVTAPNPSKMTGPGTNSYLVGETEVAAIDPGPVIDTHLDAIQRSVADRRGSIRWIVVTHHHPDHAPAAEALAARTGATVIGFGHADDFNPHQRATDGYVLSAPGFSLRALHTPGHASDHICWLLEERSLLFSGDHVMQGSTVVIRPPDGNMIQYLASLGRLRGLQPALRTIAPGHGRMIGDPAAVIDGIVRHRYEREEQVIEALAAAGDATVEELLPMVYTDVDDSLLDVARHSLWAHLEKLAEEGRARMRAAVDAGDALTGDTARWVTMPL